MQALALGLFCGKRMFANAVHVFDECRRICLKRWWNGASINSQFVLAQAKMKRPTSSIYLFFCLMNTTSQSFSFSLILSIYRFVYLFICLCYLSLYPCDLSSMLSTNPSSSLFSFASSFWAVCINICREVLKDLLPNIRFPLFTVAQLAKHLAGSNLVPEASMIALYTHTAAQAAGASSVSAALCFLELQLLQAALHSTLSLWFCC